MESILLWIIFALTLATFLIVVSEAWKRRKQLERNAAKREPRYPTHQQLLDRNAQLTRVMAAKLERAFGAWMTVVSHPTIGAVDLFFCGSVKVEVRIDCTKEAQIAVQSCEMRDPYWNEQHGGLGHACALPYGGGEIEQNEAVARIERYATWKVAEVKRENEERRQLKS